MPVPHENMLSPIAIGWLNLAATKVITFGQLQKDELAVQSHLAGIKQLCANPDGKPDATLADNLSIVQKSLGIATSLSAESKARRLSFTNQIAEKLIAPAMEYEKRSTALIESAQADELGLRKIVSARQSSGQVKETEKANLTAHIKNEHFRIAAKYRLDLETIIFNAYKAALEQKQTPDQIPEYKTTIRAMLADVKLDLFVRFNRAHVTDAEALAIFQSVPAYDATNDLITAYNTLENKFAMYSHDLQNSAPAIQAQADALKQTTAAVQQEIAMETSTNNLMAGAATMTVSGSAKVKMKMDVVEENSEAWEMAVISSYIKNFMACQAHIQAKERKNRKLSQFATALGKLATEQRKTSVVPGAVYDGLTLMVVEK